MLFGFRNENEQNLFSRQFIIVKFDSNVLQSTYENIALLLISN
jgi:hypothetical protein